MTTQTQVSLILLKRGETSRAATYTGPVGELVVDTDVKTIRIQDGLTPGGTALSKDGHIHRIADVTDLQSTLDSKAPLDSAVLIGTPTTPTPAPGDATLKIANAAFVPVTVLSSDGTNALIESQVEGALAVGQRVLIK